MRKCLVSVSAFSLAALLSGGAIAQESGTISKAVGGYTFEDAAKEARAPRISTPGRPPDLRHRHPYRWQRLLRPGLCRRNRCRQHDRRQDPVAGFRNPVDDPAREIEILNQIIQDPTIDGIIMTTPQAGAYDDIVKTAEKNGIPVATTNSFDAGIHNRLAISHTGQDASAAAIAGNALVQVPCRQGLHEGLDRDPQRHRNGEHRSQQSRHRRLQRHRCRPEGCRQARQFQGRCRSREGRRRGRHERPGQRHRFTVRIARRRGRRVRPERGVHSGARSRRSRRPG